MYVCMYVWSFFLALRGQNGPYIHTYIHTYTHGYLQLVDRFVFLCMFEVCVSFRGKNRATLKSDQKKSPHFFQNPYFL